MAGRRSGEYRYLLDLDLDLAESLDVGTRLAARSAATALTFEAEAGEIRLAEQLAAAGSGYGILVLGGALALNITVGDRTASELLGPGDLMEACEPAPDDDLLACATEWRALLPMRFAILDGGFADRVHPFPQIARALLHRAERRMHNLNVQRAIAAQPRLDVRLSLLLWHLAGRWGRVEPGGVRLPLPLTHQLLGHLIGAERPSVSHALRRLAGTGVVTGHGDDWHLHGTVTEQHSLMWDGADARAAVRELRGRVVL